MSELTESVERRLREEHADVVGEIGRCADAVAAEWESSPAGGTSSPDGGSPPDGRPQTGGPPQTNHAWTTDRDAVVPAFERALDASGVLAHLPRVLSDSVRTVGQPMPAPPVAAPPYVVVRTEGVLLRAAVDAGRLVVAFDAFAVERGGDGGVRYVRLDGVDVGAELR